MNYLESFDFNGKTIFKNKSNQKKRENTSPKAATGNKKAYCGQWLSFCVKECYTFTAVWFLAVPISCTQLNRHNLQILIKLAFSLFVVVLRRVKNALKNMKRIQMRRDKQITYADFNFSSQSAYHFGVCVCARSHFSCKKK